MLQDEIKKNVKIADTIKVVMIPTAVATIGWVAKEKILYRRWSCLL